MNATTIDAERARIRQQILAGQARRDAQPALTLRQPFVTVGVNGRRDRVQVCRFRRGPFAPKDASLRVYRRVTASSVRRLLALLDRPGVAVAHVDGGAIRAVVGA
jgi:hypothetical protein